MHLHTEQISNSLHVGLPSPGATIDAVSLTVTAASHAAMHLAGT